MYSENRSSRVYHSKSGRLLLDLAGSGVGVSGVCSFGWSGWCRWSCRTGSSPEGAGEGLPTPAAVAIFLFELFFSPEGRVFCERVGAGL